MGVDIETYRGRIGSFKFALGADVVMLECIVNFSYGVKSVCAVVFIGLLLLMAGIEPNPGPLTTGDSQEEESCTTILVSGIPSDVDETYLKLVFKNTKKQGGGKVKSVQLNEEERTALVEFEDPKAVQVVLMKRPIKIADCEVGVEAVTRSQCTVEVQGFPMIDSIKELLELYFEDEESSGGDTIVEIKLIADGKALVTYETEEVARRVAAKKDHVMKTSLNVTLYKSTESGVDHSVQDRSVKALEEIAEPVHTESDSNKPLSEDRSVTEPVLSEFQLCKPMPEDQILIEQVQTESELSEPLPEDQIVIEQVQTESDSNKPLSEDQSVTELVLSEFQLCKPMPEDQILIEQVQTESELSEPLSEDQIVIEQVQTESVSTESKLYKPSPEEKNQADLSEESELGEAVPEVSILAESEISVENDQSAQGESSTEAEATLQKGDEDEEDVSIQSMLHKLGLLDKYPEKIAVEDVTSISLKSRNEKVKDASEVPWILLRQIISIQCKARDASTSPLELEAVQGITALGLDKIDFLGETTEEEDLSPLDVFNLTLECCDKMLKQLLFKKLYLCKIATPFLYKDRLSLKSKISIWPLRSLVVYNKLSSQMEPKKKEFEVLELPLNTITFCHFGTTHFSKSKLINKLISGQIDDTFYNKDCRSGSARRSFSKSIIEFFCLPALGDNKDVFPDAVSFFNMRGNIETDFSENVVTFVAKLSDVVGVVVDIETFKKKRGILTNIISNFSHTILIVNGFLESKDIRMLKQYREKSSNPITPVPTFKGNCEKNFIEIVSNVRNAIISVTSKKEKISIESRVLAVSTTLDIDEADELCANGKLKADNIFKAMIQMGDTSKWKELVTPVNHLHSHDLGARIKGLYRLKNVSEIGQIEDAIKTIRQRQLHNVTPPIKLFVNAINDNMHSCKFLQYMFEWLSCKIEREKRLVLPQLIQENIKCWKILGDLKRQQSSANSDEEMKKQIDLTEASQKRIEDASLGIEHLFREIGHVYDSLMVLDKTVVPESFGMPGSGYIVEAVANLVVRGQPFELVDGDSFYMPIRWVSAVFEKLTNKLNQKKVLALSVLGLQSSGKSTLLNTMFGSQFPVKSGRCTRGINVQLLPIKEFNYSRLPFEFILVIDTEGLRAPELNPNKANHDKELSTIIAGLGDITLLNIMGENTTEIRDILQVVVYAFLRLKLVNKSLDIGKSFYLLHQNVDDVSAEDNMRTGLQVLIETLDNVAKDAAEEEGITEISSFNQIIEFDMTSNVWYLPNYWQGNPPVTRVNSGYSERLYDQKCKLFKVALDKCNKSYQTLNDLALHMQDLWKGVLTEDFVYRFRNSLEIKAYVQLEETLKENLIQLENEVENIRVTFSQEEFSKCEEQDQLQNAFDRVVNRLQQVLAERESFVKQVMTDFFDNNDYSDTIVQWKDSTFNRIRLYCSELEIFVKTETVRLREITAIDIMTAKKSKQHEKVLYERSLRVAKETKGKNLSDEEINDIFEETWKSVLSEIVNVDSLGHAQTSIKECVIKCLFDVIFTTEKMILKSELDKRGIFSHDSENSEASIDTAVELNQLKGSFRKSGIGVDDIGFSTGTQYSEDRILAIVEEKMDYLFEKLDLHIARSCQRNMEITQTDVKNVLMTTKHEVEYIHKGNTTFTLKITAVVKLFIHVGFYVQNKFDKHNKDYEKSHGIEARLNTYKLKVKEHFIGFIHNRKAEETAARQICITIESILHDKIKERLPVAIKAKLLNSLTHLKFHLMLEMLEDMTKRDDFYSFIKYINHPKLFAEKWITKKSETLLFDSSSKKYSEVAAVIVAEFYDDLRKGVRKSVDALRPHASPSTERWLECFTANVSIYKFQLSSFSDIHKTLQEIEDMDNFTTALVNQIKSSENKLIQGFQTQKSTSVKWSGLNPYEDFIQKAWGCPEQCAFCCEPCAKDKNHEGAKHYSLQHRLSCCKGVRSTPTQEASITSCSYDIQSEQKHHCRVFDYLCNPSTRGECDIVWHKYSDYRTYLPNWDIEPNSNMQDCAKFWLWFVATYKKKLANRYRYVVSNVPRSWNDITKEEALENLRRIYTGSS